MEGNQEKLRKKNMCIKIVGGGIGGGGGGLAGILLLGGALALVTTFAFKRKHRSKNKQEDSLKKCRVKEDDGLLLGEGLSFLVQQSLSPHHDHSPSNGNGTLETQHDASTQILLDENSEINVRNDEEMDIPEKARDNTFCDETSINKEELPVPVADSSLALKLEEVNKKNDSLDEVEVMKADKETMTSDCNQIGEGDAYNDWQVLLRIDGNNREQVKAAHADDQPGLDGKAHKQGEECDGNGKTLIKRKEILVEGAPSNQPGPHDGECDGNGDSILEKREEPVEAAVMEVVAANRIILSEELEAITAYGDEDILCCGGTVLNETDSCDLKKPKLLLPLIDSSSVIKPGDNDLFEVHLVVEDTKILKGDEANKPPVENREQTQVVEANGDIKEYCMIYRENSNDEFEEADEISVENDQQMQSGDECQKIHINGDQDKYNSGKSLPEINSCQSNGFQVEELSFPPLDSPSLFKPGKLNEYDSAQTTLHVEVINPVENKPSVESAKNDEMHICEDGGDSGAAKGEEILTTSVVDIAQPPTKSSEEEDNNDDSNEDAEAVETIQRENFEEENNLRFPQKDHADQGVEDDSDEEEDIDIDIDKDTEEDDVEESSETTGDSSNAEGMLEFSQKGRDVQANKQHKFKEMEEEDSYVEFNSRKLEDDDEDSFMMPYSDKLSAETTTLKHPPNIFNLKFWFLPLVVPFLLLLWLSLSQLSYFASFQYHLE